MEALIVLGLSILACVVVVRGFALLIARSSDSAEPVIAGGREAPRSYPSPPPFSKRDHFFSAPERSFYEMLCRCSPAHTVFAKVRLADLVRVEASGREFWQRFHSINGKHVDFLVCDEQLAPLVAIELDDLTQTESDRVARDKFVDSVLESAELPVVRVRAKRGYVLDEVRQLLAPHLRLQAPNVSESADAAYIAASAWRPSV